MHAYKILLFFVLHVCILVHLPLATEYEVCQEHAVPCSGACTWGRAASGEMYGAEYSRASFNVSRQIGLIWRAILPGLKFVHLWFMGIFSVLRVCLKIVEITDCGKWHRPVGWHQGHREHDVQCALHVHVHPHHVIVLVYYQCLIPVCDMLANKKFTVNGWKSEYPKLISGHLSSISHA